MARRKKRSNPLNIDWSQDWPIVAAALFGAAVVGALLVRSAAQDAVLEAYEEAALAPAGAPTGTLAGYMPRYRAPRGPIDLAPLPTKRHRARGHGAAARALGRGRR